MAFEGAQIFQRGVAQLDKSIEDSGTKKAAAAKAKQEAAANAAVGGLFLDTPEGNTEMGKVGGASIGLGLAKPWDVAKSFLNDDPVRLMTMMSRDAFQQNNPKLKEAFNQTFKTWQRIQETKAYVDSYNKAKGKDAGSPTTKEAKLKDIQPLNGDALEGQIISKYPSRKMTVDGSIIGATNPISLDLDKPIFSQINAMTTGKKSNFLGFGGHEPELTHDQADKLNQYYDKEMTNILRGGLKSSYNFYNNPLAEEYLDKQAAGLMAQYKEVGIKPFMYTQTKDKDGNYKTSPRLIKMLPVDKNLLTQDFADKDPSEFTYEQKLNFLVSKNKGSIDDSTLEKLRSDPDLIDQLYQEYK